MRYFHEKTFTISYQLLATSYQLMVIYPLRSPLRPSRETKKKAAETTAPRPFWAKY